MVRLMRGRQRSLDVRQQWAAAAVAGGWAFPSDWHVPAVDAVCDAVNGDADVWAAAERLGCARALAGVSLGETLADLDVLVTLVPARFGAVLHRAASLGWADGVLAPPDSVADAITGLASADYLKVRLGEVCRAADVGESSAKTRHALVVVRLAGERRPAWERTFPMILVGEALRTVFGGGESLARLGEGVAVALVGRDAMLPRRVRLLAELIASRSATDPDWSGLTPQVWIESLPPGYRACVDLIAELGR